MTDRNHRRKNPRNPRRRHRKGYQKWLIARLYRRHRAWVRARLSQHEWDAVPRTVKKRWFPELW